MSVRHRWQTIRRKERIPKDKQTEGKDDAAEKIEELIEQGKWPVSLQDLADATKWSRSHYANTLEDYFIEVSEEDNTPDVKHIENSATKQIDIPDDIGPDELEIYLRGFAHGYNKANKR